MRKWIIFLIATIFTMGITKQSDGGINCANAPNTVSVSGPQYVGINQSATYTCTVGTQGGTYAWTAPGFTITSGQGTSTLVVQASGTPSASKGDKKVKCVYTRPEGACDGYVDATIVKISVTPSSMNVIESKDSSSFTCTVSPTGLSPTYKWLSGSQENAWPATAGNSPSLNYDAQTAKSTKITDTQWFAPTPNRLMSVDGPICTYTINCEASLGGVKIRDLTPSSLNVEVDPTGETIGPIFENEMTIQLKSTGLIKKTWSVIGIGSFRRSTVTRSVSPPTSSDFHDKCMTHEDEHVDQWANQAPWKDLWDATTLYNSTLKNLTAGSEYDLRVKINNEINAQHTADLAIFNLRSNRYNAEKAAFDAQYADDPPDFLEMTEAEWKPLYNL